MCNFAELLIKEIFPYFEYKNKLNQKHINYILT